MAKVTRARGMRRFAAMSGQTFEVAGMSADDRRRGWGCQAENARSKDERMCQVMVLCLL